MSMDMVTTIAVITASWWFEQVAVEQWTMNRRQQNMIAPQLISKARSFDWLHFGGVCVYVRAFLLKVKWLNNRGHLGERREQMRREREEDRVHDPLGSVFAGTVCTHSNSRSSERQCASMCRVLISLNKRGRKRERHTHTRWSTDGATVDVFVWVCCTCKVCWFWSKTDCSRWWREASKKERTSDFNCFQLLKNNRDSGNKEGWRECTWDREGGGKELLQQQKK